MLYRLVEAAKREDTGGESGTDLRKLYIEGTNSGFIEKIEVSSSRLGRLKCINLKINTTKLPIESR